jgi:hypothetical protein
VAGCSHGMPFRRSAKSNVLVADRAASGSRRATSQSITPRFELIQFAISDERGSIFSAREKTGRIPRVPRRNRDAPPGPIVSSPFSAMMIAYGISLAIAGSRAPKRRVMIAIETVMSRSRTRLRSYRAIRPTALRSVARTGSTNCGSHATSSVMRCMEPRPCKEPFRWVADTSSITLHRRNIGAPEAQGDGPCV